MKGYVYVLSNESMPGLVKVGYTEKDPEGRAKELSGETGIPSPFVLEYEILVDNPRQLEQKVHRALRASRHSEKREFFRCSTEEAVIAIKESFGGEAKYEQYHKVERKEIEEAIRAKEEERINRRNAEIQEAEAQRLRAEREAEELKEQREQKEQETQRDFEENKWKNAAISITWLLLGFGGLYLFIKAYSFNSSSTSIATGIVTESRYSRGKYGGNWYVSYKFRTDSGIWIESDSRGPSAGAGEEIKVYYDPNNPNVNAALKKEYFPHLFMLVVGFGSLWAWDSWRFFK